MSKIITKYFNLSESHFWLYSLLLFVYCLVVVACNDSHPEVKQQTEQIVLLQEQVDSLKKVTAPRLGNLMLNIQAHHTKLHYASENGNWLLASFLLHELKENFEQVEKHHPSHDGIDLRTLLFTTVMPRIRELDSLLPQQDEEAFKKGYTTLTNACNSCHIATKHSFIVIQTPESGDFRNQNFTEQ